ncbi:hypothetical protein QOZ80_5AG0369920 [Eleusine coracana subsp. coracana]|nr:hypothetical protein QOZ80_5AG0369920 [Eleusine coracana subsp. coracana]
MKSSADGNGSLNEDDDIAVLVESCINMEGDLKDLLKCSPQRFHDDEISRSNKIINCMRKMIDVTCSEFPAAVIAFECIARETDLMCELAMSEIYSTSPMRVSSDIRQCALRFMSYKGGEHFAAAAATMMGATREAKVMCEVLRKERDNKKDEFSMSQFIRNRTLGAMIKIYYGCPDNEESTRINTAGKLMHDESVGNSYLDMDSVKEDNPGLMNDTKDKNKEQLIKEDHHLKERSTSQKTKVQNKDTLVGKRHEKHGSKLEDLLKFSDNGELNEESNLLSPPEQKEVSNKAVENASKSTADSKKLQRNWSTGCFTWVRSGLKSGGAGSGDVIY